MEKMLQRPVTFSCLSDSAGSDPDAISVFDASEAKADFIREVIEIGLDSGNYMTLCCQIDSLFKSGYVTNQAHVLGNIIVCLAEKPNRTKLVKLLLENDEAIKQIQAASYVHHNGFRKIVLLETKYFKLRLHVFEPIGKIVAQENIHDHRWPFASVCLKGNFMCKLFECMEFGDAKFNHYLYRPVGTNDSYSVQANGNGALHESSLLRIKKDTGYYQPENTLHQVVNRSGERVITLVITGTPVKDTCNLYSEKEFEEEKNQVERFDETDIRNAIRELKFI
ncbi:MAG: hypothetical protein KDE33_07325 [Bacteroidetes bacterium]|nr:hypothetical protein [Bacteroidota bacterium]